MRKLLVLGIVLTLCSGALAAGEPPPPAPGSVPADAVARGSAAAARCQSMTWSTEDYSTCIDRAVSHAMDADRAPNAFQLGVYCSAFYTMAQAYSTQHWKNSMVDPDDARVTTVDQYDSCIFSAQRVHQKRAEICTAVGVDCSAFNAALDHWKKISRDDM